MEEKLITDILIIGSGLAGLTTALSLAQTNCSITILTDSKELTENNSSLAQGGIVYKSAKDSPKLLAKDILYAGCQQNYLKAVKILATQGPEIVKKILIDKLKVDFAKQKNTFSLTKEGGHSIPRILFCKDFTGKAIMDNLIKEIKKYSNISILTNHQAIDLITSHHHSTKLEFRYHLKNQCLGAYVLQKNSGQVKTILSHYTVLATGGLGQIYLHSTNTLNSIGSGLSMAYRAGCRILNAEYIQFHPTSLFHLGERKFLISEAVRGEGAFLVNQKLEPFMNKYHHQKDLAPRDIVARAIVEEMISSKSEHVFLNIEKVKNFSQRFPTIYKTCKKMNIPIEKTRLIPVVPAAHYFCGGILVDQNGQTTLPRLFAGGECSCTGVHGANRLASTSLLEALVWGYRIGQKIKKDFNRSKKIKSNLLNSIPSWQYPKNPEFPDPALINQDWANIKHTMWNYVGIIRTKARLKRAFEDLRILNKRIHDFYSQTVLNSDLIKLYHACQSAYIVTTSALKNKKSIGCHYVT
ncbi:L-aspartate oxidase [Desulfonauticus submarinus]|uniref:L-aspartate oxidase n=1 Tax=Desulfonauticus submarinus TaxID=206665 RepID=A0A1H0FXT8_9BACT|nr:L-aspartate oxidase [Desulfonauticus submarinus]SDN99486.1 L-aspartate oxidase [Desulfonauticus submarinus]